MNLMIDQVTLNFNQSSLWVLNAVLGIIMFGVALDLKWESFRKVWRSPKALVLGVTCQWILLPLFTYILIVLLKPQPSMALGMILVACCPGGNISNFISAVSKADVELSIVLTCISSMGAIMFTPVCFGFYGSLYPPTNEILIAIDVNWIEIVKAIVLIIIIPIIMGKMFSLKYPIVADKLKRPLRMLSMLLFLAIVVGALLANGNYFVQYIGDVFGLVLLHNGMAISLAFTVALIFKLKKPQLKSITIETGIQNSGLGLLIIFSFFSGLGGMAIIAAWWGIWHIVSGFALAYFWKND